MGTNCHNRTVEKLRVTLEHPKQQYHPIAVQISPFALIGSVFTETDFKDEPPKNGLNKVSDSDVQNEGSCHALRNKALKTRRFPFCRDTTVTTEDMRKPHVTSLGVVPARYGDTFGCMPNVIEGQPPPTILQLPHTARSNAPEKRVCSSRMSQSPVYPLISPQLPSPKPCILPSLGTVQRINLKPRKDLTSAKRPMHSRLPVCSPDSDSLVKKLRSSGDRLDKEVTNCNEREGSVSSMSSVQSLLEEAKQIALTVDSRLPRKPQKLESLKLKPSMPVLDDTFEADNMDSEDHEESEEFNENETDILPKCVQEEPDVGPESSSVPPESLAMTAGEVELIQETLADILESSYTQPEIEGHQSAMYEMEHSFHEASEKAQNYQDFLKDSLAVIGKSCTDTNGLRPVSLIKTWQMNLRSKDAFIKDMPNADSSACDKKSTKTIHHFCMMRHDVQLPDPYKGVWSRYIVHNKYGLPLKQDNLQGADDEMIENEDDLYQRQLKAAERILEEAKMRVTCSKGTNTETGEMNSSNFTNQISGEADISVKGTKLHIEKDSMIYWTPAPPKWDIAPSRVKEVLFPEYHGTEFARVSFQSAKELQTGTKKTGSFLSLQKPKDSEEKEPEEEERRPVLLPRKYGSQENLQQPKYQSQGSDMMMQEQFDLIENYRQFSEFRAKQLESVDFMEAEHPQEDKKFKRRHSVQDDLDEDDEFLIIHQDFENTMEELKQQKQQIQQSEDRLVGDKELQKRTPSVDVDRAKCDESILDMDFSISVTPSWSPESLWTAESVITSGRSYSVKSATDKRRSSQKSPMQRISSNKHRASLSIAKLVLKNLRAQQPRQLICSESLPLITAEGMMEEPTTIVIQRQRTSSIPELLDFEHFKEAHGWKNGAGEREFARNIWNGWFDEVFPPTPKSSTSESKNLITESDLFSVYSSQNIPKQIAAKTYDADEVVILPIKDEEFLRDEDIKLLEEEVAKLTSQINSNQEDPNVYDLCRRGAILRRLGKIKYALDDLNAAIDLQPQFLDAYWHRHLILSLLNRKQLAIDDLTFILEHNKKHSSAYKARAMLLYEMGDFTLAVFNFTQALKFNPNDTDALLRRADIYEANGDKMLALDDYSKCRQINPHLTKASMKRGLHCFNNGIWLTAVDDFSQVLNVEPGNTEVRLLRGRSYLHLKLWNEALEDLSIAIHMDPLNAKAFYYRACILKKVYSRRALQDYSVSLMLDGGCTNILAYLHRGMLYSDLGQTDDAVADFEAVLKLDPKFSSAFINLGLLYMKSPKNISQLRAIQKFTCAIKAEPTLVRAYMCRAEVYQKLGDYKNALSDVTRSIHLRPDMHQLYIWRGNLLHRMGEVELARFCLCQMSEMNVAAVQLPSQMAVLQSFLKNYDKAIDVLSEATAGNGATVRLLMLRGEMQMKANRWHDAVVSFDVALKLMKNEKRPSSEISEAYYLIGVCHLEEHSFTSALDAFTRAIKANRKHAEAFYWRGFAKLKLNNPKGILDINSSIALDPTQLQAYLTRAAHYGLRGQYSKAILNCNEAIKLQPNSLRAFLYRGALKFFMKSFALAIRDLTKAVSIDATCALAYFNRAVCYHANDDRTKALQDYGVVLMLNEKSLLVKTAVNRAVLYIEIGDYYNALYDLLWAAELSPTDKTIYHSLGLCHHKLGFLNESVSYFTTALELDPFFLDGLIGRGNSFMDFGHEMGFRSAKRDYERVLHLDPLHLPVRVNLAYALQVTGKFMQAWHQFTMAIAIDSNFVPALEGRAVINLQMSNTFAAYQDICASIRVRSSAELLTNRGVIYQFMNDKVNAMRDYQRAIKLDPKYALAYFNAANIYFQNHQFSQALSYYNLTLQNDDSDESAYLNRGITYVMLKDATNALLDFERACELSPYSAHIYFNRANLFMSLQMYKKAEEDYSRAISLHSDDPLMLMRRAEARGRLQQTDAASRDYQTAIQLEDKIQ